MVSPCSETRTWLKVVQVIERHASDTRVALLSVTTSGVVSVTIRTTRRWVKVVQVIEIYLCELQHSTCTSATLATLAAGDLSHTALRGVLSLGSHEAFEAEAEGANEEESSSKCSHLFSFCLQVLIYYNCCSGSRIYSTPAKGFR